MQTRLFEFDSFSVDAPESWRDITDDVESDCPPYTLVDGSVDLGALQFSVARYAGGKAPNPSTAELLEMAEELRTRQGLIEPHDLVAEESRLRIGALSCRSKQDFFRVWFVSDGRNIAMVTYTCELGLESEQLAECESIVRTLRFRER